MSNGNVNDLELAKFIELAGQYGIRVHILHGDGWLPPVANFADLPSTGNELGDIRQLLDTGIPYRWDGDSWEPWGTSGATWGGISGTLSNQTDLQNALNAKMGAGAYVVVTQDSALVNQKNLGALTSGLLLSTVSAGVSTITVITNNSTNWNTAYTHSQTTGNPHSTTKSDIGLGNVDNTSDVNKPVSTAQAAADTAALNAAKAYADGLVVGLLDDRGNYNASGNVFPSSGGSGTAGAILKGDLWTVSVAGTLGGVAVTAGDIVRAIVDTPGQTSTNWAIAETNIGYTPENSTNKATTMTGNEASNTLYLTAKAVYDWAVGLFVQKNGAIVGATKTKVTYDAKGLVTAGADATTADIADSADKRYVTDAEKTILSNTSGTNSGNETASTIGTLINGSADQPTPGDTDVFALSITSTLRKLTFANLKSAIKSYYDSVISTLTNKTIALGSNTVSGTLAQFNTACTDADFATGGGTATGTNSGDVTLAGTPNYITIVGQVITRSLIDLTSHVTGLLPFANIASVATSTVMYRKTAGTGAMEAQTLATLKTDLGLTGTNSGDQTSIVGITGTMAQFDTAVSDGNIVYQGQALGTPASGNMDNCTADGTDKVGFRNCPINSQSAAYTLILSDAGKTIYHPSADTTARTWTIPANSSVAFPVGTIVTFENDISAGALTIAITTDTLVLVGAAGTTGSRTLAAGGRAVAQKVTSTRWRIDGNLLT